MGKVQSYGYSADILVETDEGVQEGVMSVEWAAPDRFHMKGEGLGEAAGQVNEVIIVGERVFTRDSSHAEGAWEEQPPEGPRAQGARLAMSSHRDLFPYRELENLQMLEDETVRDVAVFHIRGTRTTATGVPPTPTPGEVPEVRQVTATEYDLFISKSDYLLLRMGVNMDMTVYFYTPSDSGGNGQRWKRRTWPSR